MQSIVDTLICPITYQVMTDPVLAPDGKTYERQAITTYLNTNGISPFTRAPMNSGELTTNLIVKTLMFCPMGRFFCSI